MPDAEINRLTRWAIPGWVALLSLALFVLVDTGMTPAGQLKSFLDVARVAATTSAQVAVAGATILVSVAGVPLGFIVYQVYFFFRWNSPLSARGPFPPFLAGRQEDLERTLDDLSDADLTASVPWRRRWIQDLGAQTDHSLSWRYVELLFNEAAQKIDSRFPGTSNFARHRELLNVMHTLGASTVGFTIGFLAYFLFKITYGGAPFASYSLTALAVITVFAMLVGLEDCANKDKKRVSEALEGTGRATDIAKRRGKGVRLSVSSPASILLMFLFLLHLFNNPFIQKPAEKLVSFDLRYVVGLVLVILWAASAWHRGQKTFAAEATLSIVALVLAAMPLIAQSPLPMPVGWPFFSALTIFLVGCLVLAKNHQNARDDLLATEYYTLRRYITEHQDRPQRDRRTAWVQ